MKEVLIFLLFVSSLVCKSQDSISVAQQKHWFDFKDDFYKYRAYVYWGYNRSFFTKSDIHFHGNGYDVTVFDAKAKDRPSKFSFKTYFDITRLWIPQYNFRFGLYLKKNFHLTIGMDHLKYVMNQNQIARVSGFIDPVISNEFAGVYNNQQVELTTDFLRFEHTNGLNLLTIDAEYLLPIYHHKDWIHVGWNVGFGGMFVITKTDVKLVGLGRDNRFHLSGYSLPFKTGPRIDIWRYFFFAFEVKGGYMHLPNVILNNNNTDLANHNFGFVEYYGVFGVSCRFTKEANKISKRVRN